MICRIYQATFVAIIGLAMMGNFNVAAAQDADLKFGTLDFAMNRLADQVKSYLTAQTANEISVAEFEGPAGSTAGKAIQQGLATILRDKHKVDVSPEANAMRLSGEFEADPDSSPLLIKITATLRDRFGRKNTGNFTAYVQDITITDLADVNRLLQTNSDFTEGQDTAVKLAGSSRSAEAVTNAANVADVAAEKEQKQSVTQPSFATPVGNSSQVKPSPTSQFRLEMLVRRVGAKEFVPVKVVSKDGVPTTEQLEAGDEYIIKVYNDSSHGIGVKVFVDGINTLELSQDADFKPLGTWIVEPKSQGFIKGWYQSRDNAGTAIYRSFLLTTQQQVPELPAANGVGTISAQVFHAWKENEPTPEIELLAKKSDNRIVARGLRTGVGDETRSDLRVERSFFGSQLLASISLRYSFPEDLPPDVEPAKADL